MFDVFGDVKSLIKLESICIDNNVFRLHYKATFVILVLASLLVTSKQYIGDPIDCVVEEIPQNVSCFSDLISNFFADSKKDKTSTIKVFLCEQHSHEPYTT